MDPTFVFVQVKDSLTSTPPPIDSIPLPPDLVTQPLELESLLTHGEAAPSSPLDERLPDSLGFPLSIFTSPMSIVLANLDALYPFSSLGLGWIDERVNSDINYAVLGDTDGGAAAYIQYRTKTSWGVSLVNPLTADFSALDLNRLVPLGGDDASGQLETNWEWLIKRIRGDGDLLDFIVCLDSQSERHVVLQLLVALSVLREGGRLVIYLPVFTPLIYSCLAVMSQAFGQLNLVRPLTLAPRYRGGFLIGQDAHSQAELAGSQQLLQAAVRGLQEGTPLTSFVAFSQESTAVEAFETWASAAIKQVETAMATQLERLRSGQLSPSHLDYHKLLLLLNLPDGHGLVTADE